MNPIDALFQLIPSHTAAEFSISLILCILLALFAYLRGILDSSGSLAAFTIGIVIAIFGNIYWLLTLISFLIVTFIVTKLGFSNKQSKGVAQGKHGERNARNVLANGMLPALIPILIPWLGWKVTGLLFIVCISEAASDSFANEVGVLSDKAYLITNLRKRVKAGTHGGISVQGELAGLAGAIIPATFGWVLISEYNKSLIPITDIAQMPMTAMTLVLPILLGFLGCHIDSVLGATLQLKKLISNDTVNFLSITFTFIIAIIIISLIGL